MLFEVGTKRAGLVATVAAEHGGRTVGLRLPGGVNLVDAGERDWVHAPAEEPRLDGEWRQDYGQVVWLGPQARFWADQTAMPGRPAEAQGWPPDPICTGARYAVLEHGADRLRLRGPASPVWQVEMAKTWEALPDGAIRFTCEARNVSNLSIRKGLWFNFRAPPGATVRVPVERAGEVRLAGAADLRPTLLGGWLTLHAPVLGDGREATDAKAFVRPGRGVIRVERSGGCLELAFAPTKSEDVAEGHAPVEIYRKTSRHAAPILEVEHHGPCVELGPGQATSREEIWRWVPGPVLGATP